MKLYTKYISAAALAIGMAGAAQAADIVFLVDESGSMVQEHAWLGNMVTSLETALNDAGENSNNYGLVGFGCISGHTGCSTAQTAHEHLVGGASFGSAADLSTATGGLALYGGLEDGWEAINFALSNYSFTSSAINFILITDEDRDNLAPGLSYAGMETALNEAGVVLNAVVNAFVYTDTGARAVGADADGVAYLPDGAGGYTEGVYDHLVAGDAYAATTEADYSNLAFATGGATWDLNMLRAGGTTADSFTNAFTDIKVAEIITQTPEPTTLALMTIGLLGIGARRLRK